MWQQEEPLRQQEEPLLQQEEPYAWRQRGDPRWQELSV